MFQFRAFPSYTYLIQYMIHRYCLCVFPHSEISGSQLICSSPKLIAACRVLHRLLMPRHSPCALISLTSNGLPFSGSLELCRFQQKFFTQNCIYPFELTSRPVRFKKSSTMLFLTLHFRATPSVALLFSFPLFSFQGASEGYTLKIEQCKETIITDVQNV